MFVATLIASPRGDGLPQDAPRAAATILGADASADWLDPGFACDLILEAEPGLEARATLAALAADGRFDAVVQERAGRRKRLLLADMDSTMIEQECIDELAAELGLKDAVAAITARAMNGEIAFEPALRERVALLKDLPVDTIDRVIETRITHAPGGAALVATMAAAGARCALVSGGFTLFTGPVAAALGFHENRANTLLSENGLLSGRAAEPILGADAKVEALHEISARLGLTPADAIAVGDGANDLPMILAAGTGVALHAKPAVAAKAPHRIDHGDLTALLFVQGYKRDAFAAG